MGCIRHRAHDVEDRIDSQSVRRIDRELRTLRAIASHFDQAAQGRRLQRTDQLRRAASQRHRLRAAGVLQFIRNLEEVSDDDLIVRGAMLILIDRLGNDGRLGWRWGRIICGKRVRHECGARESYPELRAAESPLLGSLGIRGRGLFVFLQQLEPLVRDRMQPDVIPRTELLRWSESQRLARAIGLDGQRLQHVADFTDPEPALECDGAEVMAMQPTSELGKERILHIRRHAFDDELLPGNTEREGAPTFEKMLGAAGDTGRGRGKRGVPLRIHRVLVEGNGELDKEISQLSRESGLFRRDGHGPK